MGAGPVVDRLAQRSPIRSRRKPALRAPALADSTVDALVRAREYGFGRDPRREVDFLDEVGELGQRGGWLLRPDVVDDLTRRPDAPQLGFGENGLGRAAVQLKHAL